jgi:hypothetical protein
MKTKTIFKTLALAMMMPAMLLTTACSSSNDDAIINNENINNENTAKKGFEFPVTVNVTRESDATTRATYNGSTLSFSTGDKLFVKGYNWTTSFDFAGTLTWQSGGTFSGTITTSTAYSGTADELFSLNDVKVTLLPNGYGTYGFYSIDENNGYDDEITPNYNNTFASTKALAVEQFSDEYTYDYDGGFDLTPHNAILNFTITGLTASTDVNVVFTGDGININKTVTTDGSGTATFAIGVEDYSDLKDCTLTVGGNAITLANGSKILEAGYIYNVTRNVALANVTASDIGKLIGADGRIYSTQAAATTAGTTAVAMIAYVGTESNCSHGLAIALENVGNGNSWDKSNNNNGGKTAAELCYAWNESTSTKKVTGGTWRLPSIIDWQNIIIGCGTSGTAVADPRNTNMEHNGLLNKLSAAGGITLTSFYWSSTEVNANYAMDLCFNTDNASFSHASKTGQCGVRACLAF